MTASAQAGLVPPDCLHPRQRGLTSYVKENKSALSTTVHRRRTAPAGIGIRVAADASVSTVGLIERAIAWLARPRVGFGTGRQHPAEEHKGRSYPELMHETIHGLDPSECDDRLEEPRALVLEVPTIPVSSLASPWAASGRRVRYGGLIR